MTNTSLPPPLAGLSREADQGQREASASHRRGPLALSINKTVEAAHWGPDPTEAPTLVLLHEGLGSVGLWRNFPAQLVAATGCGVFAWSRFGYGRSDPAPLPWPADYMHREAHGAMPAVLDAAQIGRCLLVGHSDGASIAAIYASRQDPRVRGLVLLAPHFFVEDATIDAIRRITTSYIADGLLRARLARHHADPDMAFHGWSNAWLDRGFRRSFDLSADLARIRVPMLILQGRHDPYGTEAQPRMAQALAAGPVETVLLEAGHAPHLDAESASIDAIAGFAETLLPDQNADAASQ